MKTTKKEYIEYLNEIGIPDQDRKSEGGLIPDNAQYGNWVYKNDPIAFNVGYNDFVRDRR